MARWLEGMMSSSESGAGAGVDMHAPPFGFGDATTNGILREAARSLHLTGALRHGAEAFNFLMPQERIPLISSYLRFRDLR